VSDLPEQLFGRAKTGGTLRQLVDRLKIRADTLPLPPERLRAEHSPAEYSRSIQRPPLRSPANRRLPVAPGLCRQQLSAHTPRLQSSRRRACQTRAEHGRQEPGRVHDRFQPCRSLPARGRLPTTPGFKQPKKRSSPFHDTASAESVHVRSREKRIFAGRHES